MPIAARSSLRFRTTTCSRTRTTAPPCCHPCLWLERRKPALSQAGWRRRGSTPRLKSAASDHGHCAVRTIRRSLSAASITRRHAPILAARNSNWSWKPGLAPVPAAFEIFRSIPFRHHGVPTKSGAAKRLEARFDVSAIPAYSALKKSGLDICGLAQLASRTVGVPFVGLIAAGLAVSELLRRLHGAGGVEVASRSALSLDDVECVRLPFSPYAFGHLPAV